MIGRIASVHGRDRERGSFQLLHAVQTIDQQEHCIVVSTVWFFLPTSYRVDITTTAQEGAKGSALPCVCDHPTHMVRQVDLV
jgi:hypothetical protein